MQQAAPGNGPTIRDFVFRGLNINAFHKNIGLGYCRREVMESGPQVDLNGVAAKVVDLPFEIQ